MGIRPTHKFFLVRSTQAFTLIELIVVLAIIGVLVSVVSINYDKVVIRAKRTEAITNLRAMHSAIKAYQLANGDIPRNHPDEMTCLGAGGFETLFDSFGNDYRYCKWILAFPPGPGTACNNYNAPGFQLADCSNVRFQYSYVFWPNAAPGQPGDGWYVEARSTSYFHRGCPGGAEAYVIRGNGVFCHTNDAIANNCDGTLPDISTCRYE